MKIQDEELRKLVKRYKQSRKTVNDGWPLANAGHLDKTILQMEIDRAAALFWKIREKDPSLAERIE